MALAAMLVPPILQPQPADPERQPPGATELWMKGRMVSAVNAIPWVAPYHSED